MRVVLLISTLLVVSLAGCVSDDDPEPVDSGTQGSAPAGNAPAPAATEEADVEDAPLEEEVEVIVPYVATFTDSGSTSTGVWVCDDTSGAGECNGQELEAHSRFITYDYADTMIAATLEITWERVDSTTRLLVAEVTATPAGGGEAQVLAVGIDTSPLVIDIPEMDIAPGTLQIEVWPRSDAGLGPAFLFVDPQTQPFDLSGELTLLPSA